MAGLALMALPLMMPAAQTEARGIIAALDRVERTANTAPDDASSVYLESARTAWESDMHGACLAMVAALRAESEDALRGLRHLLPGLLTESGDSLAEVLGDGMAHAFYTGFSEEDDKTGVSALGIDGAMPSSTANAVRLSNEPHVTDAMKQLRGKTILATDRGHGELRGLAKQIRQRSLFSARTTNAHYLQEVADVVDRMLSGEINQATARWLLMRKLKELGYDPAMGFPGDVGSVPPAERGSLQDLSSERRINLVLETQLRMATGYGKTVAGNQPYELREYPAWELVRIYPRHVERGERVAKGGVRPDPAHGWPRRWEIAGTAVDWEGAVQQPMIARKDSPLWQALGDGTGSTFTDTLGNPYEPFALNSGMGRKAVARRQWDTLCGRSARASTPGEPSQPTPATLAPTKQAATQVYQTLASDMKAALAKNLADLELEDFDL